MSEARAPRQRRRRGAAESLASIVLGFESIIVFLGGLVLFGLKATPAGIEPWWGIVAGSVLAVLLVLTSGVLRHTWGIALGWFWQLLIVLGGLLEPGLAVVGLIFGAMYAYATIKGASLDRLNAQRAEQAQDAADHTNGD
ncbi:DUF4233 domain-containing protein [Microbacterium telephonicum]|nr:DUF4233 domain-containing protein [Microbacterium telephonicum]